MSSTPDNSDSRYKNPNKNLNYSHSYIGARKSYTDQSKFMDSSMRMMKMRQSESTKPVRNLRGTGRTPNKIKGNKVRASSNPRLGSRDIHYNSSVNIKGRKGQLMSSSRLGKIINEQTSHLLEQKERIKEIYDPNNVILKSGSNNIKVTDEFPLIKNKNLNSASKVALNTEGRGINMRYSQLQSNISRDMKGKKNYILNSDDM